MPLSREGPVARAHSAATVGASSLVSSKSAPLISGPPVTVRVPSVSVTVAPMAVRMPRQRSPTCVVSAGQLGIRTVPRVARAAARNGPALERSCSIRWSKARIGPGETTQWFGTGIIHGHADAAQHGHRHVDVVQAGHGLARVFAAAVFQVQSLGEAGAGQQQGGHKLRGGAGVDDEVAAADFARALDGERQRRRRSRRRAR